MCVVINSILGFFSHYDGWIVLFTGIIAAYGIRQYALSEKSSQRELRAYICITSFYCEKRGGEDKIKISFENSGKTPAQAVKFFARTMYSETNSPCPQNIPEPWAPEPIDEESWIRQTTAPGGKDAIEFFAYRFKDKENSCDDKRNAALYVSGKIVYKDEFNVLHETNFRYMQDVWTGGVGRNDVFRICENGNEAT